MVRGKRYLAFITVTVMCVISLSLQSVFAESSDTEIYHYLYSDYTSGGDVSSAAGITRPTNNDNWQNGVSPSWGTPTGSAVGTLSGVWWFVSSKTVVSSKPSTNAQYYAKNTIEQNFATVNLDKDDLQNDSYDGITELDFDFGVLLAGAGSTPYMKLPITAITENGDSKVIAMPVINGQTLYFEGMPDVKMDFTPKTTIDGKNAIGQRTYMKMLFDRRSNTYSVYYLKKSNTGDTVESTDEPKLIIDNQPFYEGVEDKIAKITKFDILMKYQTGSDQFAPVEITMKNLCDDSINDIDNESVDRALKNINVNLSKEEAEPTTVYSLKLPTTVNGRNINWLSNSEYIKIADDGSTTITEPPAEIGDQVVCLTASVTCGDVSSSINYYAKVKAKEAVPESKLNIGDYMELGSYNGEKILWRCVNLDKNGMMLISDKVISVKPFDFAGESENGSHARGRNSDRKKYGSNYWNDSNIKCWLNSNATVGNIVWLCGNAPIAKNVLTTFNGYADEAGFKSGFSDNELTAVKNVTLKTILDRYEKSNEGNDDYLKFASTFDELIQNYNLAFSEENEESFFLPDIKQISAVKENSSILGDDYFVGKLTQAAADKDNSPKSYSTDLTCAYWLRTPSAAGGRGYKTRIVYAEETNGAWIGDTNVGASIGVRPAFYFNDNTELSGNGTIESPYIIK